MRLQTATRESAIVHGKTEVRVMIGNISVSHVFIVANIVDEVIIGADFIVVHGINLNMGQKIMSWRNVEIPPDVGYKHQAHARRIFAIDQQK